MRDILFRGKRVDTGEWVEGYFCKYPRPFSNGFLDSHIIIPSYNIKRDRDDFALFGNWEYTDYIVIPETVQQFTGVFDRNGGKLFEGDIVDVGELGVITYNDASFIIEAYTFMVELVSNDEDIKVLGNIIDNPELLGGG